MKTYVITLIAAAGLLAGCNQSIESASEDFNTLPEIVQKTVRAEAPNAEIGAVSKTTENGVDAYKIRFRHEGKDSEMVVAMDGRILSSDLSSGQGGLLDTVDRALTSAGEVGTKFSALPAEVQQTIQSQASGAQIADIERHEENGRVIYEVEFKDEGQNPSIRIAADGTLVQKLQK